ncbi:MAG: filamentous hemagglutinin N-terminal domain-containing protein, partial [Limnothrix sp. RL_2_0]|nr:filamentous hemagglutinin N-terminal domain-containing protein [Limnothrix sp. RL_2_0]
MQNILSRISSGNHSFIDGLIQINGSDANLYLLNPAGIVFGNNAQLNIGGDFTASTAWGLEFDGKLWTNGTDYTTLIGSPTQFLFDGTGAIINTADLSVTQGQNLNLFASNVVNTGSLTAEEGQIQIIAVPGSNTLRLSQAGQILGLEINPSSNVLAATNLPALLTGSPIDTGLSLDNGTVTENATAAEISPNSGSAFITGNLDASGNMGGKIHVFGQDIDLVGANLDASGTNGGGEILVGGDYLGSGDRPRALTTFIDKNSVLNTSATNTGDGGKIIIWSDKKTDFDGSLYAKGGANIGNGGFAEISSKNILDIPAGWSQRINVGAVNGLAGKLLFDPNDITIVNTGPVGGTITDPEDATDSGNILLDSDIENFLLTNNLEITTATGVGGSGNITVNTGVDITNFLNTLTLTADNNIIVNPGVTITANGGTLVLNASNNIAYQSDIAPAGVENINFQAGGSISTANISTNGGFVNLQANGGNITTGDITTAGGAATFSSTTGGIAAGAIDTSAFTGGGAVNLSGNLDIVLGSIDARGTATVVAGGNVDIVTNGFLRVTNVIGASANSINTSGFLGGTNGDLNITHGGGLTSIPFVVGDSSTNGTTGALTTGSETISTGSFPGNYVQGVSPGRITISTTVPVPPTVPVP